MPKCNKRTKKFGFKFMNIQFMKFRKLSLTFSFALLLISIVSLVFKNLGSRTRKKLTKKRNNQLQLI